MFAYCSLVSISPILQPAIAGALGPIASVSASASPILERNDRIQQQPMSLLVVIPWLIWSIYFLPLIDEVVSIHPHLNSVEYLAHFARMKLQASMESSRGADVKPRILENTEKIKSWKSSDISDSSQLKTLKLPDPLTPSKVCHVISFDWKKLMVILVMFNFKIHVAALCGAWLDVFVTPFCFICLALIVVSNTGCAVAVHEFWLSYLSTGF